MEPKRTRRTTTSAKRHNRAGFITTTFTPQGLHAIKCFVKSAKAGESPELWVTEYLAKSFEEILAGVSAEKALGLSAGHGRKRTREAALRDQIIAAEVEHAYAKGGRGTLEIAVSQVANHHNLSPARVLNLYKASQRARRSSARLRTKKTDN